MAKRVRSARGELVDFDLISIKSDIASAPETVNVKARTDFIERRLRRRVKKAVAESPTIDTIEESTDEVEELDSETEVVDQELDQETETEQSSTTRKARSKRG